MALAHVAITLTSLLILTTRTAGDATPGNIWLDWNLDPILLGGILAVCLAYTYAAGPWRRRLGAEISRAQIGFFLSGTIILILSLVSPLDALGDTYLFSAHMIQHMLIAVVVPPLWLLGVPGWMISPLFARPLVGRVARGLAQPIVAFGLFNLDLWLWHLPALYDATLSNDLLHIFEHLTFIALGVLYWTPILSPTPEIPRMSRGFAVLYLFMGCQPMVVLGALLTFAAQPLYQPYVTAPHIWGTTPLADQQLGGLIMWLPTNVPYLLALSLIFFRWVGDLDRKERGEAGEFDGAGFASTGDVAQLTHTEVSPAPLHD